MPPECFRLERGGELVKVCTSNDYPLREMDWSAWIDGEEEGLVGYGATELAAVEDLKQQVEAD